MPDLIRDENMITRYQKLHLVSIFSKNIYNIFKNYDGDQLEELKNSISNERDYYDLIDLINKMKPVYVQKLRGLFLNNKIEQSSPYYTKLLVDIDNTTIENQSIAPITYQNRMIIPGLTSLLKYYSGNGKSTVNFLSARPKLIENQSILLINHKLAKDIRFSFLTGTFKPIIKYTVGKLLNKKDEIQQSYLKMAYEKFNNYLELKLLYPNCQFVFFGDDSQGDPYLADKITNHNEKSWAAIRIVSDNYLPNEIKLNNRIIFHKSYYELAYRLIILGLANSLLACFILQEYQSTYQSTNYSVQQVEYDLHYIKQLYSIKQ